MSATLSVVRFSPKPELREYVNVALIVGRGGYSSRLLYDPEFPRLRCTSPEFRAELMRIHLDAVRVDLEHASVSELPNTIANLSPQFSFGGVHSITLEAIEEPQLKGFVRKFLSRPTISGQDRQSGPKISSLVGGFLAHQLGVSDHLAQKRVKIGDILQSTSLSRQLAGIRVPRAIVGNQKAVLLDGLCFSGPKVRTRADRIRFVAFGLTEIAAEIRATTGLSVHCGTVLLDEPDLGADQDRYLVKQVSEYSQILSATMDVSGFAKLTRQAAGLAI